MLKVIKTIEKKKSYFPLDFEKIRMDVKDFSLSMNTMKKIIKYIS